jgi:hypothetical protein
MEKEVRSGVGGIMEEEDTRWDSLSVRLRRLRALLFLYRRHDDRSSYTIAVSSCNGVKRTRDRRRQCGRAGGDGADATSTRETLIFFYRHMKLWRVSSAFFLVVLPQLCETVKVNRFGRFLRPHILLCKTPTHLDV